MRNQDICILIVEDEGIVALDLQQRLMDLGYTVPAIAVTGRQALEFAAEVDPHLILMDIRLSGDMDGITAAQQINALHNVPVIYLTAYSDQDTFQRAKATLPYGYLYKPYTAGQLQTTIEIALHKHAIERDLAESRERHKLIFELTSDFYYLVNVKKDGLLELEWVAGAVEAVTGLKKEKLNSFDVCVRQITASDISGYEAAIQQVLDNQDSVVEYRIQTKAGQTRWLQDRIKPIYDEQQQRVTRIFGAARDITAQRQVESEIKASEERFRKLLEQAPYAMLIYAPDGSVVLANQALRDFWNLTPEMYDYLIKTYNVLKDEQIRDRGTRPLFEKAFAGEPVYIPPFLYEPDDPDTLSQGAKALLWSEGFLYPIKDEAGQVVEVVMMQLDVTGRVQAEQAQQQYIQRLKVLREIDENILNTTSPPLIAKAALNDIKVLVPYHRASVALFDFEAEKFEILAVDEERETNEREGQVLPLEVYENTLELLCDNEPYIMHDLQSRSEMPPISQELISSATRSVMIIPLFYQEQLTGVLNLVSDTPSAFQTEHIRIAQDVANPLAIAIEQARLQSELTKYAEELEERVAERTAELQAANASLQEMSRIRDEFISNVSHELRTPLANLKVYHDLLRLKPEEVETYLITLDQETERLRMIVESILQISQLDQEQAALSWEVVNLNKLLSQFVSDRLMLAQKRGLILNFSPSAEGCAVNANPDLLGRTFNILFTNALNYTPSGGQINFQVKCIEQDAQRWASFAVQDTGLGISEADKPRLFERFYRGEAALTSNEPGSGLGLSIAEEIVKQHGGNIIVESSGIAGQGTTVTVLLPLHEK